MLGASGGSMPGGGQRRHTTRREQMAVLAGVRLRAASAAPRVEQAALAVEWRRHQRAGRRGGDGVEQGAVEQWSSAAPCHALRGHGDGRGASSPSRSQLASGYTGDPEPRGPYVHQSQRDVSPRGPLHARRVARVRMSGGHGQASPVPRSTTGRGTSYLSLSSVPPYLDSTSQPPVSTPVPRGDESQRRKGLLPGSGGAFASGASMPAARLNPNSSTAAQHSSTAAPQHRRPGPSDSAPLPAGDWRAR